MKRLLLSLIGISLIINMSGCATYIATETVPGPIYYSPAPVIYYGPYYGPYYRGYYWHSERHYYYRR